MKPGCATGALKINKSGVSITSSENGLVIRFEGNIVVKKNSGDLKLDIQKIIEALQNADDAEDIKKALSTARGSLQ